MPQTHKLQSVLPAPLYAQLQKLSEELDMSVSDVGAEACVLFLKAAREVKRGAQVAFIRRAKEQTEVREFSTNALTQLEMEREERERMVLKDADFDRMEAALEAPANPNAALRELAQKRKQRAKSQAE
ncbi:MAG: DUF1778 domain-containing protein [Myxococcaceae bacterium]|nr:DUF1778 domain-containing protein [Myxococcaceae bacterium]